MIPLRAASAVWCEVVANLAAAIRHAPRVLAQGLIRAYRLTLAPMLGLNCRHLPTCSQYAEEAIARFGIWAGGWMTFARLCRCHPFGSSGLDFVPRHVASSAHWFTPWRYGRWRGTLSNLGERQIPNESYNNPQ